MRQIAGLLVALAAGPASGQDFSAGSAASSWGLSGERPAKFEAEVVDVLCELAGDCPADCGEGARQLGLLRSADGVLVLPMKNGEPVFSGAVADLAPYCGQTVEVDGLLVGEAEATPAPFYMVQTIRPAAEVEPRKADGFTAAWAQANPEAAAKGGEWFRHDPAVNARIAEDGHLGLGPEMDAAFIADWF
jgi:hypothetical protein